MSDEIDVACSACGAPMVERENSQNGSRFLGCTRYPDCTQTMGVPAYVEVKRAGGIELPGFGQEG
jgi:ssDNA-binding Zn-finger/Zn-ribbon topoisomerase 1